MGGLCILRYSITRRLFAGVFLLLMPLLLMQGGVYLWSRETVTEEIRSTAVANLEYLHSYLDQKMQDVQDISNILLTQTRVGQFYTSLVHDAFASISEYYMAIREIRITLRTQKYSNELISEVMLFFPRFGLMIDTSGASRMNEEWFSGLLESARPQNRRLLAYDGKLYSIDHWPNAAALDSASMLLCVELNQERLEALLASYSETNKKVSCLLGTAGQYLLSSGPLPASAQELSPLLEGMAVGEVRQRSISAGNVDYVAFVCCSGFLDSAIIQLIPSVLFNRIPNTIGVLILILCLMTVVVLINLLSVLRRTVGRPVDGLQSAFRRAGEGDLDVRLPRQDAREFDQLASGFNAMTAHIDQLITTNYRQTIRLQTAELKQLQAQINPHFLYNSFYFLRHLVATEDNETAEEFCRYLGQYFHYITRSDKNTLPLREEYDHAVSYLNIQLMRFGGTVEADIAALPQSMHALIVPRLIIQPVVENCFKYGLNTTGKTGCIRISFEEAESTVSVIIENNGNDLTDEALEHLSGALALPSTEASFTGLVNTHHRLKYFYGEEAGVEVSRSALGGLLVRLRLARCPLNAEGGSRL